MARAITKAVAILDSVLIMMTAVWILVGVYRGLAQMDLWYNHVYVILNILTLILNLKIINTKI